MARNNYPEITHARILDTATRLFLEKGWEEITIQDIVDEIGDITRGAFYHHFKSKDDIIDSVTTNMFKNNNPFYLASQIEGENGLGKLKLALRLSFSDEKQLKLVQSAPALIKSPKFIAKQMVDCVDTLAPNILAFLNEGINDGSIECKYPKQLSEVFMIIINIWLNPIIYEVSEDEYVEKVKFTQYLLKCMNLNIIDNKLIESFRSYYIRVHKKTA